MDIKVLTKKTDILTLLSQKKSQGAVELKTVIEKIPDADWGFYQKLLGEYMGSQLDNEIESWLESVFWEDTQNMEEEL